jgi:hypothetical protein
LRVKKLTPTGNKRRKKGNWRPLTRFTLAMKKSAYLKYARSKRLPEMPRTSKKGLYEFFLSAWHEAIDLTTM